MIRINLLGQVRPKSARRPVDTGAALPVVFIGAGLVLGALVLGFFYYTWQKQLNEENARIKTLIRLLRGQRLDPGVFFIQLLLPGVIEESKNQRAKNQARANENDRKRGSRVHRPACGLRSNLSKQVYSNHG